jgi:hypothetical protein
MLCDSISLWIINPLNDISLDFIELFHLCEIHILHPLPSSTPIMLKPIWFRRKCAWPRKPKPRSNFGSVNSDWAEILSTQSSSNVPLLQKLEINLINYVMPCAFFHSQILICQDELQQNNAWLSFCHTDWL